MAAAWGGPVAWRCPVPVPAALRAEGRRRAGEVLETMRAQGHAFAFRRFQLPGAVIEVTITAPGQPPIIAIAPAMPQRRRPREIPRPTLWVPRGFVVHPVCEAAPLGWGFPPVQLGSDPLDERNLRPGLDVARWTPAGRDGQVLLSRLPDAGYPSARRSPPPLLFHEEYGPRPPERAGEFVLELPPQNPEWAAYRPSFTDYVDGDDAPAEWKRAMLELVNEHRASVGRDAVLPPLRGYYDSAQATADQMVEHSIAGHFSDSFDASLRTPLDRLSKDGILAAVERADADSRSTGSAGTGGENIYAAGADFEPVGIDPNGAPIQTYMAGAMPSPTAAMDAWLASPADKAVIEDMAWDEGASLAVGVRSGAAVQHFIKRESWVAAGNRSWSGSAGPTLSWMSFPTLNLFGETWPVYFDFNRFFSDCLNLYTTYGNPIPVEQLDATYLSCPITGLFDGELWPAWVFRVAQSTRPELYVKTMDCRVFCRGRVVALAPRGAAVWAAAWQRVSDSVTRLVILTHEDADQPGDWRSHGLTSILRVWYCDVDDVSTLLGNAQSVIRGVRGAAPDWPWEDNPDPWSWEGGATVDVGTTGAIRDLLKYTSLWQFSPDGRRAVCLRQHGTWQDVEAEYRSLYVSEHNDFLIMNALAINPIFRNLPDSVLLELDLSDPAIPALSQQAIPEVFYAAPGSEVSTPYTQAHCPPSIWQAQKIPLSVGFNDAGARTVCWLSSYHIPNYLCGPVKQVMVRFLSFIEGVSPPGTESMQRVTEYPPVSNSAPGAILFDNAWVPQVLSHRRQAFCYVGTWPGHGCWPGTDNVVHEVALFMEGERVASTRLPSFDRSSPFSSPFCYSFVDGDLLQNEAPGPVVATTTCNYLVPAFAESADGSWIASLRIAPQTTGDVYVAGEPTADCVGPLACAPLWRDAYPLLGESGVTYRSVLTAASFASASGLAGLTETPADGFGLITARVV